MRKLFIVMLVAGLFCSTSAVLAKEDGTEDCDAVALERVLEQARGIIASADFIQEVKPTMHELFNVIEMVVAEQRIGGTEEK